ncbi:MAG: 16S rRNA (guanine(527)-N(7))-methyltransferase RsmG [Bacteroidota bacterium]
MQIIQKYFPDLTLAQKRQFGEMQALYEDWNSKINLISRNDMPFFYERHVLHSLAIAKAFPIEGGSRVIDVGTGGGFPGIPLAILYPSCHFTLMDSIGKKIRVVEAVAKSLMLDNVLCINGRVEEYKGLMFDTCVCRAVAPLAMLVGWTRKKCDELICLKGGDLKSEIAETRLKAKCRDCSEYFEEEFFGEKKVVRMNF